MCWALMVRSGLCEMFRFSPVSVVDFEWKGRFHYFLAACGGWALCFFAYLAFDLDVEGFDIAWRRAGYVDSAMFLGGFGF